jgi:protein involved in ribonucleotide reduction
MYESYSDDTERFVKDFQFPANFTTKLEISSTTNIGDTEGKF